MNIISLISLAVIVANIALGFFAFLKNKKPLVNRFFFALTISVGIWIAGLALINTEIFGIKSSVPLYGLRVAFSGASLIAFLFLMLSIVFPHENKNPSRALFWGTGAIAMILAIISISTNLIVKRVEDIRLLGYGAEYGALYYVFGAFFISSILTGLFILRKKLMQASGIAKIQLRYFFVGSFIALTAAGTTNLLIPLAVGTSSYSKIGPLFTIVMVSFFFYAIRKHHLMNVRVIATEFFSALILIVAFLYVILSESIFDFVMRTSVFVILAIFSILLVRGTLREIRELERLSEEKSTFVSIASHQLRAPLTAIKGFISMIREGSGTEENRKDWLKKAYLSNERLIRLVNDLLNISRIERGKIQYNFKDISILKLIDSIMEEFNAQGKKEDVELRYEKTDTTPPPIHADVEKLRQVFINLIDNAVKYTSGGWVLVKISYLRDLKKIRVVVQDTGIGMSKDDLEKIFGRFSRGDGGQRTIADGTGLGLYVAKEIVKAHKGEIWGESEGVGKGSKFIVELPL